MSELFSGSMKSRHSTPRLAPHPSKDQRPVSTGLIATTVVSKHAKDRMKENSLIENQLDLIVQYGTFYRARNDQAVYVVPDSPFLGVIDPRLPEVRNMVLVISQDGTVVSVYQKDSRFREGVLK